jgi:hypothetical protein
VGAVKTGSCEWGARAAPGYTLGLNVAWPTAIVSCAPNRSPPAKMEASSTFIYPYSPSDLARSRTVRWARQGHVERSKRATKEEPLSKTHAHAIPLLNTPATQHSRFPNLPLL